MMSLLTIFRGSTSSANVDTEPRYPNTATPRNYTPVHEDFILIDEVEPFICFAMPQSNSANEEHGQSSHDSAVNDMPAERPRVEPAGNKNASLLQQEASRSGQERLEASKSPGKIKYPCTISHCQQELTSASNLKRHWENVHNKGLLRPVYRCTHGSCNYQQFDRLELAEKHCKGRADHGDGSIAILHVSWVCSGVEGSYVEGQQFANAGGNARLLERRGRA